MIQWERCKLNGIPIGSDPFYTVSIPEGRGREVPPKPCYLCTKLHAVTSHEAVLFIITAVRISNLTTYMKLGRTLRSVTMPR